MRPKFCNFNASALAYSRRVSIRRSLHILLARRYPDPTRDFVQPPFWVLLDPFGGDAFAHDLTSQTFDDRKNVKEIRPDLFANLWFRDKTERQNQVNRHHRLRWCAARAADGIDSSPA